MGSTRISRIVFHYSIAAREPLIKLDIDVRGGRKQSKKRTGSGYVSR